MSFGHKIDILVYQWYLLLAFLTTQIDGGWDIGGKMIKHNGSIKFLSA